MVDVFKPENKTQAQWFKFKEIGDAVQGTFIGRFTVTNKFNGNEEYVYEILTDDGILWNVNAKGTDMNRGINYQMKGAKLGQYVGMKFEGEKPNPGKNPTKLIVVYKSKEFNKQWLAENQEEVNSGQLVNRREDADVVQETLDMFDTGPDASKVFDDEDDEQPAEPTETVSAPAGDKLAQIVDLAKKKIPGADDANFKLKVMEVTNTPVTEAYYDAIIEKLTSL